MRVCIVAEHASTRFGGEAILPIHYFRLLRARGIETWLVVHARTRIELEQLFPEDRDRILFVPDSWLQKLLFRLSKFLPRRLAEISLGLLNQGVTQFRQRNIVRTLIRDETIDVLHQPIPVAPRFPSLLFGLGVPRVVGPLNGGMEYPYFFRSAESRLGRAAISLARQFSNLGNAILPGKKNADVILVANKRTRRALPAGVHGSIIELTENGVDLEVWRDVSEERPADPPKFVFVGRLVDWKAVDVVIRALHGVPAAELEVIGDGPMLEAWKVLASDLGLIDRVRFVGWLSQRECAVRLRSATALVLPSLYECGGAVVLEAMALGKPVIATNWGGPADYLDASCGILVEPESSAALVEGFAAAMNRLIDSPALTKSMGAAGRERVVRDFDWQRKIDQVISIYSTLIERSNASCKNKIDPISSAPLTDQNRKDNPSRINAASKETLFNAGGTE
jgi:glycosyltransferase involved in cell wall biosynthesis